MFKFWVNNKEPMADEKKELILKIIAAAANSGGELSKSEKNKLLNLFEVSGFNDEKLEEILEKNRQIEPLLAEIKLLNKEKAAKVLWVCFFLLVSSNKIHLDQINTIRKIARTFWDEEEVELIIRWLKKSYDSTELYIELFQLPLIKKSE
ncbi:MAG: hypothetical protein OEZ22_00805 [Spirochaetia bacterium]|nr:hypothetical protein [Spirochaetia bacterium]